MTPSAERRAQKFARRHHEFLRAAVARMRGRGLTAVNLTELAAESEYSKGTWYNHFCSAEALYVELALVDAHLHRAYFENVRDDVAMEPSDRLASAFVSSMAHAITHPEIWILGVNARIWDRGPDDGVQAAVERLAEAEHENLQIVLGLARAAQHDVGRSDLETTAALTVVRAASEGLSILSTAKADHRWTPAVSTRECGSLLRASLVAAGFQSPTSDRMDALCASSWERVDSLSLPWRL